MIYFRQIICLLILFAGISIAGFAEDEFNSGLLYDQFPLTLDSGRRTEAVGPLFYNQQKDSEKIWAIPAVFFP